MDEAEQIGRAILKAENDFIGRIMPWAPRTFEQLEDWQRQLHIQYGREVIAARDPELHRIFQLYYEVKNGERPRLAIPCAINEAAKPDQKNESASTVVSPTSPPAVALGREYAISAVETAMLDAWNEICADTGFHPLDIVRERGKTSFQPRHWAQLTGKWTADAILSALQAGSAAPRRGDGTGAIEFNQE